MFLDFRSLWETSGAQTFFQSLAGTLTSTGNLTKQVGKLLAGTLTSLGTLTKQVGKALTGILSSSGALTKLAGKLLAGTLTSAGTLTKLVGKALVGTLTSSGILSTTKVLHAALSGTLAATGALVKQAGKVAVGVATYTGTIGKFSSTTFGAMLTFSSRFGTWWKLRFEWLPAYWERHDNQPMQVQTKRPDLTVASEDNPNIVTQQDRNSP